MIDPLCLGGVEMIWIRNGSQSVILTEGETRCLISGCGDLIKTVGLTVGMIESLEEFSIDFSFLQCKRA